MRIDTQRAVCRDACTPAMQQAIWTFKSVGRVSGQIGLGRRVNFMTLTGFSLARHVALPDHGVGLDGQSCSCLIVGWPVGLSSPTLEVVSENGYDYAHWFPCFQTFSIIFELLHWSGRVDIWSYGGFRPFCAQNFDQVVPDIITTPIIISDDDVAIPAPIIIISDDDTESDDDVLEIPSVAPLSPITILSTGTTGAEIYWKDRNQANGPRSSRWLVAWFRSWCQPSNKLSVYRSSRCRRAWKLYIQPDILTSGRSGGILHVFWTCSQPCGARVQFYGFRSVEVLLDTLPGSPKNCPEARGGSVRVQISLSRPVSFFMVKPRLCRRQYQSSPLQSCLQLGFGQVFSDQPAAYRQRTLEEGTYCHQGPGEPLTLDCLGWDSEGLYLLVGDCNSLSNIRLLIQLRCTGCKALCLDPAGRVSGGTGRGHGVNFVTLVGSSLTRHVALPDHGVGLDGQLCSCLIVGWPVGLSSPTPWRGSHGPSPPTPEIQMPSWSPPLEAIELPISPMMAELFYQPMESIGGSEDDPAPYYPDMMITDDPFTQTIELPHYQPIFETGEASSFPPTTELPLPQTTYETGGPSSFPAYAPGGSNYFEDPYATQSFPYVQGSEMFTGAEDGYVDPHGYPYHTTTYLGGSDLYPRCFVCGAMGHLTTVCPRYVESLEIPYLPCARPAGGSTEWGASLYMASLDA
ncbi:hypothetical protein DY000_02039489 [Brassica cretica]|uniref:CCHC-type domain-containing protein n=1 Tax=Brassica cretica TaxID=69181 RepID=A0ABQ7B4K5_BRACR|nr:hypothetical protein DY000_02039489 [Brassica cretica]